MDQHGAAASGGFFRSQPNQKHRKVYKESSSVGKSTKSWQGS